jgi:hypothetical protein
VETLPFYCGGNVSVSVKYYKTRDVVSGTKMVFNVINFIFKVGKEKTKH